MEAGELGCRRIAEKHGVGATTVSRHAREAGFEDAFDRERTKAATEAHMADADERQAELRARLLASAHDILDGMGRPVWVWAVGTDTDPMGERTSRIMRAEVQPGPVDIKNLMQAVSSANSQALAIARAEAERDGTGQVSAMLGDIWEGLQAKQEQRKAAGFYDE